MADPHRVPEAPPSSAPTLQQDLDLALRLADAADAISLPRFGAVDLQVSAKPDLTPVTDADMAVERAIREILAAARPGSAPGGAGCWTRSTAPRTSSAACRSGRA